MQRRAVAVYVALFVLVGAAAGALVATADAPEVSFEDPDHRLSAGEQFEENGVTYTVTELSRSEEEDHGEVTVSYSGTIEWNESADQSADWANDSTVTYDDTEWTVVIEGDDPDRFTLREEIDRQAILESDENADNETVQRDGEEYVIVEEDGEATLVPADEYFPEPEEREFATGDTLEYDGHEATVDAVSADAATLIWEETVTRSSGFAQEENVTAGDTTYLAYFTSGEEVVLTSDQAAYQAQLAEISEFGETTDALWRVIIANGVASLLLLGLAFVPSRY
ncbi:hypothetical protein [Haloparvum sedimenti]|uniref:hypothetical protein n=1 Tax=Haloparvum sedimenti TaxID=1678448 RepID=UPI00071E7E6C|nr:hypothetical protein [Haloparvum sedimenti]